MNGPIPSDIFNFRIDSSRTQNRIIDEFLMISMRKRISHKFLMVIMMVSLTPIVIMGICVNILVSEIITRSAVSQVTKIAEDHSRHLDTLLQERLQDLSVFSKLPGIRDTVSAFGSITESTTQLDEYLSLLNETLVTISSKSQSYEGFSIILRDGSVLWSTQTYTRDFPESRQDDVIERTLDSASPVFGTLCSGKDQKWHVQVWSKIQSRDGRPFAFLVAALDLSRTVDPIVANCVGMGETGETFMVDGQGRIISESRFLNRADTLGGSFDSAGIRSAVGQKNQTATYINHLGREVIGSSMWLPAYGWGVVAEVGKDEIRGPLGSIRTLSFLLALLASMVCFFMALIVSRRVAAPINTVANAASRISEGELEQRISFSSPDEVGVLAESFNVMARRVSSLIRSLRERETLLQHAYDDLVVTQDQLVQSEKMAAIGELVTCIAHEMRNPLSSVRLNLEILNVELEKDAMLTEHCRLALDQTAQLERMFSGLLDYSKPLVLHKSSVSVEELIRKSIHQLRSEISAREIQIVEQTRRALPHVQADADMIVQVLVNLMKNAVETSLPGGRIAVGIDVEETGVRKMVVVSITDFGTGIPARSLPKIFEPFFSTKSEGTGLGLCVVKKIIDMHRGLILVTSEEGRGTTTRVGLPVVEVHGENNPDRG